MSFIQDIYNNVHSEPEKKGTFFSVVNYLYANDSIKYKDMEERFALRKSFSEIMTQLREKNIVTDEPSGVTLNDDVKTYLRPVLQSVLAKSYESKYNFPVSETTDSSDVSVLLDCRSELYKAF